MLSRSNRGQFSTLQQASVFTSPQSSRPAFIFVETGKDPIVISRAMFAQRAQEYASAMQQAGLRPRDLIIIADLQNPESMFAFWGALYLGAIPSMFPTLTEKLDPHIYMQSMSQLARISEVSAVLTTEAFAPELAPHVPCPVYSTSALLASYPPKTMPPHVPHRDEIAFLQHSSGTTGLQKGVALSHTAVLNQLASYSDSLLLREEDVIVSWLPLYHDMGLIAGFILPLFQGIPLVIMSPFDWVRHPALLFRAIDQYQGTLCWLPNFAYNHCARRIRDGDLQGLSLRSMRAFINCSEPVRHDSHLQFQERFAALSLSADQLAVSYAMAENVFAVTQTPIGQAPAVDWIDSHSLRSHQQAVPCPPDHPDAAPQVSCGPPIDGVQVQILDPEGQPLADRQIGEIAIRTDSLFTGYYRRAELQPFTPEGWYRTGDMGYTASGEVYVVGRYKDLIINAGKNVYPQDVEAIVNTIPGVHPGRVVAFGVPDEREGTELIAVVAEVEASDPAQRQHLSRHIRQQVSQQSMVTISYVHLVEPGWLIKTSSGKIARAANREKWLSDRGS